MILPGTQAPAAARRRSAWPRTSRGCTRLTRVRNRSSRPIDSPTWTTPSGVNRRAASPCLLRPGLGGAGAALVRRAGLLRRSAARPQPGGAIAVWTYARPAVDGVETDAILQEYSQLMAPWWPPERVLVDTGYRTIRFPFDEVVAPAFELELMTSREQLARLPADLVRPCALRRTARRRSGHRGRAGARR